MPIWCEQRGRGTAMHADTGEYSESPGQRRREMGLLHRKKELRARQAILRKVPTPANNLMLIEVNEELRAVNEEWIQTRADPWRHSASPSQGSWTLPKPPASTPARTPVAIPPITPARTPARTPMADPETPSEEPDASSDEPEAPPEDPVVRVIPPGTPLEYAYEYIRGDIQALIVAEYADAVERYIRAYNAHMEQPNVDTTRRRTFITRLYLAVLSRHRELRDYYYRNPDELPGIFAGLPRKPPWYHPRQTPARIPVPPPDVPGSPASPPRIDTEPPALPAPPPRVYIAPPALPPGPNVPPINPTRRPAPRIGVPRIDRRTGGIYLYYGNARIEIARRVADIYEVIQVYPGGVNRYPFDTQEDLEAAVERRAKKPAPRAVGGN